MVFATNASFGGSTRQNDVNLLLFALTLKLKRVKNYLSQRGAFEFLYADVDLNVLVQVSSLCKLICASLVGADKGSLTRVHPYVVKEVVPLVKVLLTNRPIVIPDSAHQNFYYALRERVLRLKNKEIADRGDVL